MLSDISISYLLFRPVSTPKTHVLNHETVLFTLNIHRMWYCCVLVLTLQETGEIGRNQGNYWILRLCTRPSSHLTRVASDLTRVASNLTLVASTFPDSKTEARWRPNERNVVWEGYKRPFPATNRGEGIPPKFKPLKESFESRDQEKEKSIGEGLERKQEVKIERSSRIASILQAWSWFVLSFSLLFFFPPCMSRSSCF